MAQSFRAKTKGEIWQAFADKIAYEGFDYAVRDYSGEVCQIDPNFRALVEAHNSAKAAIEEYVSKRSVGLGLEPTV